MFSNRKRKILIRVMAALALGASFLGIASSISAKIVLPKKTQLNLKRKREMQTKKDLRTKISNLATKEAEQVLTQQQISEEVSEKKKKQIKQKINPLKFFGLTVWGVSLAIFAASLIANAPLPLGNWVLMAMPGERHTAVLFLEPTEGVYQVGNEFSLDLIIDTGGRNVSSVVAGLQFEPEKIQVQQIDISRSDFKETVENSFDNVNGKIKIIRTFPKSGICNSPNVLAATIKFKPLFYIGETKINFIKDQNGMTNKVFLAGGSNSNILKKTNDGFYKIIPKTFAVKKIKVKKINQPVNINARLEDWQDIASCDLFSDSSSQNKIESENIFEGAIINDSDANVVFVLAWNEENIYLAAAVVDDQITDEDSLEINLAKEKFIIDLNKETEKAKISKIKGACIVEAVFSWETFNNDGDDTDRCFQSGDKFNFNIIINDYDKGEEKAKLIWSENKKGMIELE